MLPINNARGIKRTAADLYNSDAIQTLNTLVNERIADSATGMDKIQKFCEQHSDLAKRFSCQMILLAVRLIHPGAALSSELTDLEARYPPLFSIEIDLKRLHSFAWEFWNIPESRIDIEAFLPVLEHLPEAQLFLAPLIKTVCFVNPHNIQLLERVSKLFTLLADRRFLGDPTNQEVCEKLVSHTFQVKERELTCFEAKLAYVALKGIPFFRLGEQKAAFDRVIPHLDPVYAISELIHWTANPDSVRWLAEAVRNCPPDQLFPLFEHQTLDLKGVFLPLEVAEIFVGRILEEADRLKLDNRGVELLFTMVIPFFFNLREGMLKQKEFECIEKWIEKASSNTQFSFALRLMILKRFTDFPLFFQKMGSDNDILPYLLKLVTLWPDMTFPDFKLREAPPPRLQLEAAAAYHFPDQFYMQQLTLEEVDRHTECMERLLILYFCPWLYPEVMQNLEDLINRMDVGSQEGGFNFTLLCHFLIRALPTREFEPDGEHLFELLKAILLRTYAQVTSPRSKKAERYRWLVEFGRLCKAAPWLMESCCLWLQLNPLFSSDEAAQFRPAHKVALLQAFQSIAMTRHGLNCLFPKALLNALIGLPAEFQAEAEAGRKHYKILNGEEL